MRTRTRPYLLVFLLAAIAVLPPAVAAPPEKALLTVTFLDVRQGDSIVIRTPDNKTIVIDGGQGATEKSRFDAGAEVLIPFLEKAGVARIDMVVATHPDFDHLGGLVALLRSRFPVGAVLDSGVPHTSQAYENFMALIKEKKIPLIVPKKGELLDWGMAARAQVLAPQVPPEKRLDRDLNNSSIVIRLDYGAVSFLFTGDSEFLEENEILSSGARARATVLKAGHHGSRTASSPAFYYAVNPEVVVISAGKRNKFDHPHWESVKMFRESAARVLQTDQTGTITIATDGKTYEIL
jgi:beta-lactamase superfamily II metal-dependent hydrolase